MASSQIVVKLPGSQHDGRSAIRLCLWQTLLKPKLSMHVLRKASPDRLTINQKTVLEMWMAMENYEAKLQCSPKIVLNLLRAHIQATAEEETPPTLLQIFKESKLQAMRASEELRWRMDVSPRSVTTFREANTTYGQKWMSECKGLSKTISLEERKKTIRSDILKKAFHEVYDAFTDADESEMKVEMFRAFLESGCSPLCMIVEKKTLRKTLHNELQQLGTEGYTDTVPYEVFECILQDILIMWGDTGLVDEYVALLRTIVSRCGAEPPSPPRVVSGDLQSAKLVSEYFYESSDDDDDSLQGEAEYQLHPSNVPLHISNSAASPGHESGTNSSPRPSASPIQPLQRVQPSAAAVLSRRAILDRTRSEPVFSRRNTAPAKANVTPIPAPMASIHFELPSGFGTTPASPIPMQRRKSPLTNAKVQLETQGTSTEATSAPTSDVERKPHGLEDALPEAVEVAPKQWMPRSIFNRHDTFQGLISPRGPSSKRSTMYERAARPENGVATLSLAVPDASESKPSRTAFSAQPSASAKRGSVIGTRSPKGEENPRGDTSASPRRGQEGTHTAGTNGHGANGIFSLKAEQVRPSPRSPLPPPQQPLKPFVSPKVLYDHMSPVPTPTPKPLPLPLSPKTINMELEVHVQSIKEEMEGNHDLEAESKQKRDSTTKLAAPRRDGAQSSPTLSTLNLSSHIQTHPASVSPRPRKDSQLSARVAYNRSNVDHATPSPKSTTKTKMSKGEMFIKGMHVE